MRTHNYDVLCRELRILRFVALRCEFILDVPTITIISNTHYVIRLLKFKSSYVIFVFVSLFYINEISDI